MLRNVFINLHFRMSYIRLITQPKSNSIYKWVIPIAWVIGLHSASQFRYSERKVIQTKCCWSIPNFLLSNACYEIKSHFNARKFKFGKQKNAVLASQFAMRIAESLYTSPASFWAVGWVICFLSPNSIPKILRYEKLLSLSVFSVSEIDLVARQKRLPSRLEKVHVHCDDALCTH